MTSPPRSLVKKTVAAPDTGCTAAMGRRGRNETTRWSWNKLTYDGAGNTSGTSGLLCPGVSNTEHIQWGWRGKDSFHKATVLLSLPLAFCHDAAKLWTKFRFSSPSFMLCNKATMSCSSLRKPFYLEKRPGCEQVVTSFCEAYLLHGDTRACNCGLYLNTHPKAF